MCVSIFCLFYSKKKRRACFVEFLAKVLTVLRENKNQLLHNYAISVLLNIYFFSFLEWYNFNLKEAAQSLPGISRKKKKTKTKFKKVISSQKWLLHYRISFFFFVSYKEYMCFVLFCIYDGFIKLAKRRLEQCIRLLIDFGVPHRTAHGTQVARG